MERFDFNSKIKSAVSGVSGWAPVFQGPSARRASSGFAPFSMPASLVWFVSGIALGAVGLYFLDPNRGRYRRHVARDKALSYGRQVAEDAEKKGKDLANRAQGVIAEASSGSSTEKPKSKSGKKKNNEAEARKTDE